MYLKTYKGEKHIMLVEERGNVEDWISYFEAVEQSEKEIVREAFCIWTRLGGFSNDIFRSIKTFYMELVFLFEQNKLKPQNQEAIISYELQINRVKQKINAVNRLITTHNLKTSNGRL